MPWQRHQIFFFTRFTIYVVIFAGSNFTVQNISINFQDFKILRSAVFISLRLTGTVLTNQWLIWNKAKSARITETNGHKNKHGYCVYRRKLSWYSQEISGIFIVPVHSNSAIGWSKILPHIQYFVPSTIGRNKWIK